MPKKAILKKKTLFFQFEAFSFDTAKFSIGTFVSRFIIFIRRKITAYCFTLYLIFCTTMKKKFITVFVILFSMGTIVCAENVFVDNKPSVIQDIMDVLRQNDDDLTEFDILNGTSSSKPRNGPTRRMAAAPAPIRAFYNESTLKLVISLDDIFDIKIVDKYTGKIVKTLVINPNVNPETYIDVNGLDNGTYTIYFDGRSATGDDDYYYGSFTI